MAIREFFLWVVVLMIILVTLYFVFQSHCMGCDYSGPARRHKAKMEIAEIVHEVRRYQDEQGKYPSVQQGLSVIDMYHSSKDPWGNNYIYRYSRSGELEVGTFAADGVEGGLKMDDEDIFTKIGAE